MPKPTFSSDPIDAYRLNRLRLAYQTFCFLMQLHCHIEPSEKGFIRHMHDDKGRLLVQWSHEEALIEYRCLMEKAWLSLPSTTVVHGLEMPNAEEWVPIVSRC
jgi:hypothetical protein